MNRIKIINICLVVFIVIGVAYAAVTKVTKAAITNSTIDSTTIGATTPSSGVFSSLSSTGGLNSTAVGNTTPSTGAFTTLSTTGLTVNTSFAQGSAFKHQRGTTCTTPSGANAGCATTVTWNSAFADTNYTYICTVESLGGFVQYLNEDPGSKTASSIHFQIINTTGNTTAANGTYNCAAWHD